MKKWITIISKSAKEFSKTCMGWHVDACRCRPKHKDARVILSINLSIHPSIHLSVYRSIHLICYLAIYLTNKLTDSLTNKQTNKLTIFHTHTHVTHTHTQRYTRRTCTAAMHDQNFSHFFKESLDFDENAAASDCTIGGAFCILLALLSL